MSNDSITFIQQEIRQYKKNCVAQRQLEIQLFQDSSLEKTALTQRLFELKVRTQRVRSWMLVLNEDEEFVIRRHLIDEVSWPRLEAEHIEKWKEYGKNRRIQASSSFTIGMNAGKPDQRLSIDIHIDVPT